MVIADAGPLIALARIDQLRLLRDLFKQVAFTEVVAAELGLVPLAQDHGSLPGVDRLQEARRDGWLTLIEGTGITPYEPLNPGVDAGEASAIALALALQAQGVEVLLIVDDRCGRAEAQRLMLPLIGTAAVLLLALEAGLLEACGPLLQALRQQGYWISDGLMRAVLDQAGEE